MQFEATQAGTTKPEVKMENLMIFWRKEGRSRKPITKGSAIDKYYARSDSLFYLNHIILHLSIINSKLYRINISTNIYKD